MKAAILQFAKTPVVGEVKTRMMRVLSAEQACSLHQAMLLDVAKKIATVDGVHREIWSTAGGAYIDDVSISLSIRHRLQCGDDLGERLAHAVSHTLDDYEAVVVVGSDCPFLTKKHYDEALRLLSFPRNDLVLAPAADGGYVLIAMKAFNAQLFTGIHWGTAQVLEQTLSQASDANLHVVVMETLPDIDRPEDLACLPDSFVQYRGLTGQE